VVFFTKAWYNDVNFIDEDGNISIVQLKRAEIVKVCIEQEKAAWSHDF